MGKISASWFVLGLLVLNLMCLSFDLASCSEAEGDSAQGESAEANAASGEEPATAEADDSKSGEAVGGSAEDHASGEAPTSAGGSESGEEHRSESGEEAPPAAESEGAENASASHEEQQAASSEEEKSGETGGSAEATGESEGTAAEGATEEAASGEAPSEEAPETSVEKPTNEDATESASEAAEASTEQPASAESVEEAPPTTAEEGGSSAQADASPEGQQADEAASAESKEAKEGEEVSGEASAEETGEQASAAGSGEESKEEAAGSGEAKESAEDQASAEEVQEASESQEEIPDPGPQPGEPAFEYGFEDESSEDIARDRALLDDFAASEESPELAVATEKALKELKKVQDNSVKPLETVYEYNSITSRTFGDAEINSNPLILVMGPSGTGKTTAIKYLLGIEAADVPRIPAGPVAARDMITIWRWAEEAAVETGTELASDWVFASMQRYGLATYDRLVGLRLPAPLLKKVTIVDTPAIIESIGHVEEKRTFPRSDVYQWFIDRADLILLVFDPLKPDVGLELEAVLDQLKGREGQTRILINKADTISASALSAAQGDILWNLSPMLGGNRSPQVYSVSLRPRAYKPGSCTKLISHQEHALYRDIMDIVNNKVAHKAAAARRHAIRVRNHSKLVNLYLKAYARAKGLFSNKKKVALSVIDDPFAHRVYQEVGFAKNVSRYDLPDPEVYREFFHEHKLFDFKKFEDLCTYFKGCPQDKLDIAIAYDFAEVLGKYRKDIGSPSAEPNSSEEVTESSEGMPAVAA